MSAVRGVYLIGICVSRITHISIHGAFAIAIYVLFQQCYHICYSKLLMHSVLVQVQFVILMQYVYNVEWKQY